MGENSSFLRRKGRVLNPDETDQKEEQMSGAKSQTNSSRKSGKFVSSLREGDESLGEAVKGSGVFFLILTILLFLALD